MKRSKISDLLKVIGPGLLFAGAAIGGSHLVQSTRAGAGYGYTLLGVVILVNILKYPFFQFAHRYVAATGESLLDGYRRLGKTPLLIFLFLVGITAVFNIAAITLITTGLVQNLLGVSDLSQSLVALLVALGTLLVLVLGSYPLLDKIMKFIIPLLALATVVAVVMAGCHPREIHDGFVKPELWNEVGFGFIIALMGWMPAPIDVSVWPSLWMVERNRLAKTRPSMRAAMFDFHLGYVGASVLAVLFLLLGVFIMYGSGVSFSANSVSFSQQIVAMYVSALGSWSSSIILIIVFLTMLSTTFTVYDAYPRTIHSSLGLLSERFHRLGRWTYWFITLLFVILGLSVIFFLPTSGFKLLIDLATIIGFLMAPAFAWVNLKVVISDFMPKEHRPSKRLLIFSWISIVFLALLSVAYLLSMLIINH